MLSCIARTTRNVNPAIVVNNSHEDAIWAFRTAAENHDLWAFTYLWEKFSLYVSQKDMLDFLTEIVTVQNNEILAIWMDSEESLKRFNAYS